MSHKNNGSGQRKNAETTIPFATRSSPRLGIASTNSPLPSSSRESDLQRIPTNPILPETGLRIEEARFRILIENFADSIALISPEGLLKYLSPAFERILGLRTSDWLDRSLLEIV